MEKFYGRDVVILLPFGFPIPSAYPKLAEWEQRPRVVVAELCNAATYKMYSIISMKFLFLIWWWWLTKKFHRIFPILSCTCKPTNRHTSQSLSSFRPTLHISHEEGEGAFGLPYGTINIDQPPTFTIFRTFPQDRVAEHRPCDKSDASDILPASLLLKKPKF